MLCCWCVGSGVKYVVVLLVFSCFLLAILRDPGDHEPSQWPKRKVKQSKARKSSFEVALIYSFNRHENETLLLGCQTQSESAFHFLVFLICIFSFYFFGVGKSLACHSPAKWCLCT